MIIGLTGGIASGKSFCTDFFQEKGVPVVDADVIAREVVRSGSPLLAELKTCLGEAVLLADGRLNRAWLREKMFADENIKRQVNALMHPFIRKRAEAQLMQAAAQAPWVLYSVPLLFENALDTLCAAVIVVDVPPLLQISRGVQRDGVSEEHIRAVMAAQLPRAEKLRRAQFIIDNSGSRSDTRCQCAALYAQLHSLFR